MIVAHRLSMFENRVLKRTFEPEEVIGGRTKLQNGCFMLCCVTNCDLDDD
jgi:hypothetical protein